MLAEFLITASVMQLLELYRTNMLLDYGCAIKLKVRLSWLACTVCVHVHVHVHILAMYVHVLSLCTVPVELLVSYPDDRFDLKKDRLPGSTITRRSHCIAALPPTTLSHTTHTV